MASSRQSRLHVRFKVSRKGAKPRSSDERRTILATPFRDVLRGRALVGRAQAQACAGAAPMGANVAMAVTDSVENASVVVAEPPRVEPVAPAVGRQPGEPVAAAESQPGSAAKPRKRGRPKKVESEGKAEKKTEAKPTAKRQKSRFDS